MVGSTTTNNNKGVSFAARFRKSLLPPPPRPNEEQGTKNKEGRRMNEDRRTTKQTPKESFRIHQICFSVVASQGGRTSPSKTEKLKSCEGRGSAFWLGSWRGDDHEHTHNTANWALCSFINSAHMRVGVVCGLWFVVRGSWAWPWAVSES